MNEHEMVTGKLTASEQGFSMAVVVAQRRRASSRKGIMSWKPSYWLKLN